MHALHARKQKRKKEKKKKNKKNKAERNMKPNLELAGRLGTQVSERCEHAEPAPSCRARDAVVAPSGAAAPAHPRPAGTVPASVVLSTFQAPAQSNTQCQGNGNGV